jgi:hypothetical protein
MNAKRSILGMLVAFLPACAQCQSFAIDWFTIDGGGGTSTGGVYSVSGTIGQPDAGRMTGASYALDGGFWGFVGAIQTVGAPLLSVERIGASVRVFWPSSTAGFVLDEAAVLGGPPSSWNPVGNTYETNATQISITISAPIGAKYYRLRKQ